MFSIDSTVERISNGFIVKENDSEEIKMFYPTLEAYVIAEMLEPAKEEDIKYKESNSDGDMFSFKAQAKDI